MIEAPKIDRRTGADVAQELFVRLHLDRLNDEQRRPRADAALVQVFSRFSELVIDRLNRAPGKKYLAFLDFLGLSPLPPQAATVPLTFTISPGALSYTVVPAGTRAAASPAAGSQRPVMFETLADLVVSALEIDSLLVKNGKGGFANLAAALLPIGGPNQSNTATVPERAPGAAYRQIPHCFYVSLPAAAEKSMDRLSLQLSITADPMAPANPGTPQWEIGAEYGSVDADPTPSAILSPQSDTTGNLTTSGEIVFQSLPPVALSVVNGQAGRWLCCRHIAPAGNPAEVPEANNALDDEAYGEARIKAPVGPLVTDLIVTSQLARTGLRPEQAFYEHLALDVSKDFLPFGQRPRLGDAFYLACREAFSEPTAVVTIHFDVSSAETLDAGLPQLNPQSNSRPAQLSWEYWDGTEWAPVIGKAVSAKPGDTTGAANTDPAPAMTDHTLSFLRSGKVEFAFPAPPVELNLSGSKNFWIRVRINAGDYGRDVLLQKDAVTGAVSVLPATLKPPALRSLTIDYTDRTERKPAIVLLDEWKARAVVSGAPWRPFASAEASSIPALYARFKPMPLPPGAAQQQATPPASDSRPPSLPVNAYVLVDEQAVQGEESPDASAAFWEYRTEDGWKRFTVADETRLFRKTGLIQVIPPPDFVAGEEFGLEGYWLRVRLSDRAVPPLRAVLLNTTMAIQGVTIVNDILGASSGEPLQTFRTTYPSVLTGQRFEVGEPTMPSQAERKLIASGDEDTASMLYQSRVDGSRVESIQAEADQRGKPVYWVCWREVDSFHDSGPRDRHYVLDHDKGEVMFGDGLNGMIPPILAGNLRMTYRTGGGLAGNRPALAIKQLVNAVPYVQKVANWIPATGGNDVEPMDAFIERGPTEMRHGGRAVTGEDYEDLAMKASREVARAHCVPLTDLRNDPAGSWRRPGLISLVVVPRSNDPRPVPGEDLLERVKTFLDARRLNTAQLLVVGPHYVNIDVDVEVVVNRPQDVNRVEQAVAIALDRYLHPLIGGEAASGWPFGQLPQRSHLYHLLEKIPGVSYVGRLNLTIASERPETAKSKHLLVCSGRHTVTMTLEVQGAASATQSR